MCYKADLLLQDNCMRFTSRCRMTVAELKWRRTEEPSWQAKQGYADSQACCKSVSEGHRLHRNQRTLSMPMWVRQPPTFCNASDVTSIFVAVFPLVSMAQWLQSRPFASRQLHEIYKPVSYDSCRAPHLPQLAVPPPLKSVKQQRVCGFLAVALWHCRDLMLVVLACNVPAVYVKTSLATGDVPPSAHSSS